MGYIRRKLVNNAQLVFLKHYKGKKMVEIIKKSEHNLTKPNECFIIHSFVKTLSNLKEGEMAEVGVYNGETAIIIAEAKGDKELYLFDTFNGLPETQDEDKSFYEGQFKGSEEISKRRLSKYKNVHIYKGIFPKDTGHFIEDKKFSFVNLDVDLYKSTLECLKFFYPRMVNGGIILMHDYIWDLNTKKAINEFFEGKPENVFELAESQAFIVKQ